MDGDGWQNLDEALSYGAGLLVGEKVRLRAHHEEDLPQLDEWWNDPRVAVFNARAVRPRTPGAHHERFHGWAGNDVNGTAVGFSVIEVATGEYAGHVGLFNLDLKEQSATFGIVLGPPYWSRGLGSEATALMVRYGFDEYALHRIQLTVFAYNERAVTAYRKAGFEIEGRHRHVVRHDGRWHDELTMAVLEPQWRATVRR